MDRTRYLAIGCAAHAALMEPSVLADVSSPQRRRADPEARRELFGHHCLVENRFLETDASSLVVELRQFPAHHTASLRSSRPLEA